MSSQSPVVVLYSSDGYELAVVAGSAIPANTRGILIAGSDGTDPRFISTDTSGHIITVSNGATAAAAPADADLAGAVVNTSALSGLTNLDMYPLSLTTAALLRIDGVYPTAAAAPSTDAMYVAGAVTTAAPTYTTGQMDPLSLNTAGGLRIDGVSATAATTGGTAMLSGGATTTAAPTYTTGQMDPLSLTTLGGLRIDGVYAVATANATAADVGSVGGYVTTTVPTYTTGQLNPLSITTAGGLRVDGAYIVGTANATAADVMNSGGYVTTSAPTYTTGQLNPFSLDTAGNLRVIGSFTPTKSTTGVLSNVTSTLTNTVLLASNAARLGATFFNDSPTEVLYIALSTSPASLTQYSIKLMPLSYWELPIDYTGQINGIWNNQAGGAVRITELT